jgi:hypothetical protein
MSLSTSDKTLLWIAGIAAGAFVVHDLLASQRQTQVVNTVNSLANRLAPNAGTGGTAAQVQQEQDAVSSLGTGATASTMGFLPWDAGAARWGIPRPSGAYRN